MWYSKSKMKGHEMYFEWYVFRRIPHFHCTSWFELAIETITGGDHSPRFEFRFMVLNVMLLEITYYNSYHEVDYE